MKLSKFFHTSPSNVMQCYEKIMLFFCRDAEFMKFLQTTYRLTRPEVESLGGEFLATDTQRSAKEKPSRIRSLDGFM